VLRGIVGVISISIVITRPDNSSDVMGSFDYHTWWDALDTTLCDEVCQWLPKAIAIETDRLNNTEILWSDICHPLLGQSDLRIYILLISTVDLRCMQSVYTATNISMVLIHVMTRRRVRYNLMSYIYEMKYYLANTCRTSNK